MTSTMVRRFVGVVLLASLSACSSSQGFDVFDAGEVMMPDGATVTSDAPPESGADDAGCSCGSSAFAGCIDLRVDDDNCGACGHQCPGETTCNAGVCGPAPTIIEPARTSACDGIDLAITGTTLLWADETRGQVLSAAATAGAPTIIASSEDRPRALAVAGDEVFWLAGVQVPDATVTQEIVSGTTVRAAPLAGGVARTVIRPAAGVDSFTVSADGQIVYYSTATRIEKASATTSSAPVVVVAQMDRGDTPVGLALDGSTLAFIGEYGGDVDAATLVDGRVSNCPPVQVPDAAPTVLCTGVGRDIDGKSLVATGGTAYYHDQITIKRASLTARSTQRDIADADEFLTDITLADGALFLSGTDSAMPFSGEIFELPLGDAQPSVPIRLVRAQNAPASVAADATHVYWSTADCAIKSVPHP